MLTLKQWRRAKGFSVAEMAERLGIHHNTYIKWEENSGKISVINARKIADILEVDVNDINFFCSDTPQ